MENDYKEMFEVALKTALSAICAFVLLALACMMCGCSTRYVPVPEYHTESLRTDTAIYNAILRTLRESEKSNQRSSDSILYIDKECVTLNEQGDTTKHVKTEYIYLTSYKEKEYERIIEEQNDSIGRLNIRIESEKADSVPYPVEKIVEVERKATWWEKTKEIVGGIVIFVGLLWGIIWIVRKKFGK